MMENKNQLVQPFEHLIKRLLSEGEISDDVAAVLRHNVEQMDNRPTHGGLSALDHQVGGTHYKDCKIQPIEYITANELGFLAGCIVKRLTRYNRPTGKGFQDLEKCQHEIELLIEHAHKDGIKTVGDTKVTHSLKEAN